MSRSIIRYSARVRRGQPDTEIRMGLRPHRRDIYTVPPTSGKEELPKPSSTRAGEALGANGTTIMSSCVLVHVRYFPGKMFGFCGPTRKTCFHHRVAEGCGGNTLDGVATGG